MYYSFNLVHIKELYYLYCNRIKNVDSVAASKNILSCIERYQIFQINKIINMDYHRHIIDINLESYFSKKFSS